MKRDYLDLWGGALLALCGLAVAAYSVASYDFGELRRIGPGFFPTMLGVLLAGLGVVIAVPAALRRGEAAEIALKEAGFVLLGVLVFALTVERAGLIVATVLTVLIAAVPAPRKGYLWRGGVAVVVAGITWAIFVAGLGMTLPVWPWSR